MTEIVVALLMLVMIGMIIFIAIEAISYGEELAAGGILLLLMGLIATVMVVKVTHNEITKPTEGNIVEKGYKDRSCTTRLIPTGKTLVPNRTCISAYDYVVIESGGKQAIYKVESQDDFEIGEYYEK